MPSNRPPTSHEIHAGAPWDDSYRNGAAPWDIGRPQQAFARLAAEGVFTGTVLDAGCGTGEHTLLIASLGLPVLGVDVAETALAMARRKAEQRGLAAGFQTADALHLDRLDRTFDTVLDCGLFHTFNAEEKLAYTRSLTSVTNPGSILYLLCFSDKGPQTGPHPVSEHELRAAFPAANWTILSLTPDRIETTFGPEGLPAWFAKIRKL